MDLLCCKSLNIYDKNDYIQCKKQSKIKQKIIQYKMYSSTVQFCSSLETVPSLEKCRRENSESLKVFVVPSAHY